MKINGKAIVKKLAKEKNDRKKVSLYLSSNLYDNFTKACKKNDVPASKVMEELMQSFVNSLSGIKR